jgi:hypothetical protein
LVVVFTASDPVSEIILTSCSGVCRTLVLQRPGRTYHYVIGLSGIDIVRRIFVSAEPKCRPKMAAIDGSVSVDITVLTFPRRNL